MMHVHKYKKGHEELITILSVCLSESLWLSLSLSLSPIKQIDRYNYSFYENSGSSH